jgi:hypothetical protein
MSDLLQHRRGFLRALTTLPLIGGGVTLIGNPTRADVQATPQLLETYNAWLDLERRWLVWEMIGDDKDQFDTRLRTIWLDNPANSFHGRTRRGEQMPSERAAVVLSAVGCGWERRHG